MVLILYRELLKTMDLNIEKLNGIADAQERVNNNFTGSFDPFGRRGTANGTQVFPGELAGALRRRTPNDLTGEFTGGAGFRGTIGGGGGGSSSDPASRARRWAVAYRASA